MVAICNETLHKMQRRAAALLKDTEAMRIECCNTGQTEMRDRLGMMMSDLHSYNSRGGGLCMKGTKEVDGEIVIDDGIVVQPQSGGK